jgi:protease-4
MFNISNVLKNKIGVTFDEVKTAPYADFPSATRPITPEEGARIQSAIDTVYKTFKTHVAKCRKMPYELVDTFAQGRVWTGVDAKQNGLVDGLGDLNRAIQSAASLSKMKDYKVVTYPEPVDELKSLIERFKKGPMGELTLRQVLSKKMGQDFRYLQDIQNMLNNNGRIQMTMPYYFTIK